MYDAISVLAEAFSKMYKKKLDIFQQPSSGINGLLRTNGTRDVHCATGGDFSGSPPPFENGEKISKFIRKVRVYDFFALLFYSFAKGTLLKTNNKSNKITCLKECIGDALRNHCKFI